jgi:RNA polymerase sigma factor (sigma-70 family)
MASALPSEVVRLLDAPGPEARESAWAAFLGTYNAVLLRASRSLGPEYDGAMDRYAHVLEGLRCDDFQRLRLCTADPPADFSIWLAVVARRLSLDHYRARYGRSRKSPSAESTARRTARRRVEDLLTENDPDVLPDEKAVAPDEAVTRSEQRQALSSALAQLSSRDRLLVRFRFDESCSASEIARLMDFPTVFHVYRRINAVLATLRASLRARGIDSG